VNRLSVIADASALIALDTIDLLERLEPLFARCVIPPAVAAEIAPTVDRPSWIAVQELTEAIPRDILEGALGRGETEAIALALELDGYDVVLDERRARRLAAGLGLPVIGTLGILVRAKDAGMLNTIRPSIEALIATRFSPRVIEEALREVGEL
jgi:predicted nucleic acid-binding protein